MPNYEVTIKETIVVTAENETAAKEGALVAYGEGMLSETTVKVRPTNRAAGYKMRYVMADHEWSIEEL